MSYFKHPAKNESTIFVISWLDIVGKSLSSLFKMVFKTDGWSTTILNDKDPVLSPPPLNV